MQRSLTYKNYIVGFIYFFLFIIYESLSNVYLWMPPLFGLLLLLFVQNLRNENLFNVTFISMALLVYEAQKDYVAFSAILYAILFYKLIVVPLNSVTKCNNCIKAVVVLLSYSGYYLFNFLLSQVFLLPMVQINFYAVYYTVVELLIAILFLRWDKHAH